MSATPLQRLLAKYRPDSQTEREKGGYFEEFVRATDTGIELNSNFWTAGAIGGSAYSQELIPRIITLDLVMRNIVNRMLKLNN